MHDSPSLSLSFARWERAVSPVQAWQLDHCRNGRQPFAADALNRKRWCLPNLHEDLLRDVDSITFHDNVSPYERDPDSFVSAECSASALQG